MPGPQGVYEVMKTYRVQDYRAYASSALREAKTARLFWIRFWYGPACG